MKKLLCSAALAALGLLSGCGEPDVTQQPGFHPETASDPLAVKNQMAPGGNPGSKPGTAEPSAGGAAPGGGAAPAGTPPATNP